MSAGGGDGFVIWFDLTTPNPQAAMAFYHDLFGWEYTEDDRGEHGFYRMVTASGHGIGGLISMAEIGVPDDDVPAHWMPYLFTSRVDAVTQAAAELGAEVHAPPRDIPGVSRFAVLTDPHGGTFAPMQPLMEGGSRPEVPPVGSVIWYDLRSADVEASAAFYERLFGYELVRHASPDGPFIVLKQGGIELAGIGPCQPKTTQLGWCIYVRVADIEQARTRAVELGGELLTPVVENPGTGKMSTAKDPTGAVFGILEPAWL